jgi:hypothetical protein
MNNVDNGNNETRERRPVIVACRLTLDEYEDFRTFKNNSNSRTNSIAIRKAINIANEVL